MWRAEPILRRMARVHASSMREQFKVLSVTTFCTLVREFSPLGLRPCGVEEGLSPIDTRTAAGEIWSPNAPISLARHIVRRTGIPWHLLASLTGGHVRPPRQGLSVCSGRGKPGPRLDDKGKVLVAAD